MPLAFLLVADSYQYTVNRLLSAGASGLRRQLQKRARHHAIALPNRRLKSSRRGDTMMSVLSSTVMRQRYQHL